MVAKFKRGVKLGGVLHKDGSNNKALVETQQRKVRFEDTNASNMMKYKLSKIKQSINDSFSSINDSFIKTSKLEKPLKTKNQERFNQILLKVQVRKKEQDNAKHPECLSIDDICRNGDDPTPYCDENHSNASKIYKNLEKPDKEEKGAIKKDRPIKKLERSDKKDKGTIKKVSPIKKILEKNKDDIEKGDAAKIDVTKKRSLTKIVDKPQKEHITNREGSKKKGSTQEKEIKVQASTCQDQSLEIIDTSLTFIYEGSELRIEKSDISLVTEHGRYFNVGESNSIETGDTENCSSDTVFLDVLQESTSQEDGLEIIDSAFLTTFQEVVRSKRSEISLVYGGKENNVREARSDETIETSNYNSRPAKNPSRVAALDNILLGDMALENPLLARNTDSTKDKVNSASQKLHGFQQIQTQIKNSMLWLKKKGFKRGLIRVESRRKKVVAGGNLLEEKNSSEVTIEGYSIKNENSFKLVKEDYPREETNPIEETFPSLLSTSTITFEVRDAPSNKVVEDVLSRRFQEEVKNSNNFENAAPWDERDSVRTVSNSKKTLSSTIEKNSENIRTNLRLTPVDTDNISELDIQTITPTITFCITSSSTSDNPLPNNHVNEKSEIICRQIPSMVLSPTNLVINDSTDGSLSQRTSSNHRSADTVESHFDCNFSLGTSSPERDTGTASKSIESMFNKTVRDNHASQVEQNPKTIYHVFQSKDLVAFYDPAEEDDTWNLAISKLPGLTNQESEEVCKTFKDDFTEMSNYQDFNMSHSIFTRQGSIHRDFSASHSVLTRQNNSIPHFVSTRDSEIDDSTAITFNSSKKGRKSHDIRDGMNSFTKHRVGTRSKNTRDNVDRKFGNKFIGTTISNKTTKDTVDREFDSYYKIRSTYEKQTPNEHCCDMLYPCISNEFLESDASSDNSTFSSLKDDMTSFKSKKSENTQYMSGIGISSSSLSSYKMCKTPFLTTMASYYSDQSDSIANAIMEIAPSERKYYKIAQK